MRENDEVTGLFRDRLADMEMTVRKGFWEELQHDLPSPASTKSRNLFPLLSPKFCRVAAAAAILFLLGAASAICWYFSPREEIKDAFIQVEAMSSGENLGGDAVQKDISLSHQATAALQNPDMKHSMDAIPARQSAQADEETSLSVHVSIRVTQQIHENRQQAGTSYYGRDISFGNTASHSRSDASDAGSTGSIFSEEPEKETPASSFQPCNWALKTSVGTSLPKDDFHAPFMAGVSVERRLNKRLSLEAGLQYNRLDGDYTLHTLAIPVKLNLMLASTPKVDFYAMAGGAAEKCISGAPDNGFDAEPIQLSAVAGVGVRYKMNERLALFAEPFVSHHFDTDSRTRTLHTERSTNLNLLCGVRMIY